MTTVSLNSKKEEVTEVVIQEDQINHLVDPLLQEENPEEDRMIPRTIDQGPKNQNLQDVKRTDTFVKASLLAYNSFVAKWHFLR